MIDFPDLIGFIEVDHTADIAIAVTGDSMESLFLQSILAMREIIGVNLNKRVASEKSLTLDAQSAESLLIALLNEILFFIEKDTWPECEKLTICQNRLSLQYHLFRCTTAGAHVKAVTYNQVEIIRHADMYSTMLVFDV